MRLKVQEVGKIKRQKTFDLKVEMVSLCYKTFYSSNEICGLYYKTITIVIMMIVSNATIWSVTFDDAC